MPVTLLSGLMAVTVMATACAGVVNCGSVPESAGSETRLDPIPSRTTFWFATVGAFPDVELARG